jgi:hypothetical protein
MVAGSVPKPTEIEAVPVRLVTGFTTNVAVVLLPPGSQLMLTAAGVATSWFAACIVPMQAVSPSSATTALEPVFRMTDESIRGPFLFRRFFADGIGHSEAVLHVALLISAWRRNSLDALRVFP